MRRPKKPLIIYDGQCSFCINAIKRIRKQAKEGQFEYITNQDPDLYIAYPQLVKFLSHEGMRFINQKGKAFCGADSVYQIYRRLRWSQYIGSMLFQEFIESVRLSTSLLLRTGTA